jgi:hypothetical protein
MTARDPGERPTAAQLAQLAAGLPRDAIATPVVELLPVA